MNQTYISIQTIDETILNYIKDVMKPMTQNYQGISKQVPIVYNGSQKWVQIRRRSYIIDQNGNTLYPLISFSRTGTSDGQAPLINKAWAMKHRNFLQIKDPYTKHDPFNQLTGEEKTPHYYKVNIPINVQCSYQFQIYTDTNWQMNQIIQSFMIHNRMWWIIDGYRVFVKFSGFNNTRQIQTTTERLIKADFSLQTKSMIYPKGFNEKLQKKPKKIVKIEN